MEIGQGDGGISQYSSPYEAIGGAETVARLVETFYKRVARHPDLIPIFPDDLRPVAEKQFAFLTQFFGGPPLFSQEYGPPRLRMRHLPHPITRKRTEAWLACMKEALDEAEITGPMRAFLWDRLQKTAYHMVNTEDDGTPVGW